MNIDLSNLVSGTLANGVRYALWPSREVPLVASQIWVQAGSSHEDPQSTGVAHLLEHLMFRGTQTVPDGEFDREMERVGASINAFTWLDYTAYTATAPSAALDRVLELEADRFSGLAITEEVFRAERDVVANERRQVVESDPDALASEALDKAAFEGGYSWPTIGWADHIDRLTLEETLAFHRAAYHPENTLVVLAGDLEPDEVLTTLNATFGAWRSEVPPMPPATRPTPQPASTRVLRTPARAPRVLMAWHAPPASDDAHLSWRVFDYIVGSSDSSRLTISLEMQDRTVLEVDSSLAAHRHPGLFRVEFVPRRGVDANEVIGSVRRVIGELAESGPTEVERVSAVRQLELSRRMWLSDLASRAELLGESWAVTDQLHLLARQEERLDAVTSGDVQSVAEAVAAAEPTVVIVEAEAGE